MVESGSTHKSDGRLIPIDPVVLIAHKSATEMANALKAYARKIEDIANQLNHKAQGDKFELQFIYRDTDGNSEYTHKCGKHGGSVGFTFYCNGGNGGG